jgi:hypothetical protein
MRVAAVVRITFALLVLATVVSRLSAEPARNIDMRAIVSGMLARQGFEPRLSPRGLGNALPTVDVDVAGCAGTVRIMLLELAVPEAAWLSEVLDPKASKRFVYLGGAWPEVDRIGMRLEWLKHRSLAMLGLGRYDTALPALLLVGPAGCDVAGIVDWRTMWDRQVLKQVGFSSG